MHGHQPRAITESDSGVDMRVIVDNGLGCSPITASPDAQIRGDYAANGCMPNSKQGGCKQHAVQIENA